MIKTTTELVVINFVIMVPLNLATCTNLRSVLSSDVGLNPAEVALSLLHYLSNTLFTHLDQHCMAIVSLFSRL
jgi:hypothetical protein